MKQRVFYNKPPVSYNSVQISLPTAMDTTTTDDNDRQSLFVQHEKLIQQKKINLIAIHLPRAEQKYYQCQKAFDNELSTMWENHRNLIKGKGMLIPLTTLIEERLKNITDRWRDFHDHHLKYYLQTPYGDAEYAQKNGNEHTTKRIGFPSFLHIHANHTFSEQQLQLLNRGPTYVPPCQMHLSSSCQSVDDRIRKQLAPLKHQMACLFTKYRTNTDVIMNIQAELYAKFKELFSFPLPPYVYQRALYEKKLVRSIRYSLKQNNLILRRTADNMNTFYLGNRQDFQAKCDEYLTKTDTYKLLVSMNEGNSQEQLQHQLTFIVESFNMALEALNKRNALNEGVYKKLLLDITKIQVSYLYFLPDVSQVRNFLLFCLSIII